MKYHLIIIFESFNINGIKNIILIKYNRYILNSNKIVSIVRD